MALMVLNALLAWTAISHPLAARSVLPRSRCLARAAIDFQSPDWAVLRSQLDKLPVFCVVDGHRMPVRPTIYYVDLELAESECERVGMSHPDLDVTPVGLGVAQQRQEGVRPAAPGALASGGVVRPGARVAGIAHGAGAYTGPTRRRVSGAGRRPRPAERP